MNTDDIKNFLQRMASTAIAMDHENHMNLISKKVQVYGIPGFDTIGYEDWSAQCKHEFAQGLIRDVSYTGLRMITRTPVRIMFKTLETISTRDGTVNRMGIEVILEKESDGQWRIIQERILPDNELEHDIANGLLETPA